MDVRVYVYMCVHMKVLCVLMCPGLCVLSCVWHVCERLFSVCVHVGFMWLYSYEAMFMHVSMFVCMLFLCAPEHACVCA